MGHVHGKHLTEMNIPWDFHDPAVEGSVDLEPSNYSHIIISTPTSIHYEVYKELDTFTGDILIEKPVIVEKEHLSVLQDARVFPGLVERYNPVTGHLMKFKDSIRNISFIRHGATGDLADTGIHDIDLAFLTLGCDYEIREVLDNQIYAKFSNKEVTFQWEKSDQRIRIALATSDTDGMLLDFDKQTVNGNKIDFTWPVELELRAFLNKAWHKSEIAFNSHKFLFECMN